MLATARPLVRDGSPQVRREIALMLQDPTTMLPAYLYPKQVEPPAEWLEAMTGLIAQYDGSDRWYLEALGIAARGREDAIYARMKSQGGAHHTGASRHSLGTAAADGAAGSRRPDERRVAAADRIARLRSTRSGICNGPKRRARSKRSSRRPLLRRLSSSGRSANYSHQLFSLWMDARTSAALPAVMKKGFSLPGTQSAAVTIADALGDRQYLPQLIAFAKQESANTDARSLAIESVATARDAQYLADFQALAADWRPGRARVGDPRVGVLGRQGPPPAQGQPPAPAAVDPSSVVVSWAQGIALSNAPNEVRVEALRLMSQSVPGLNAMLDLAEKGQVPPELVSVARNLANNAAPPPAPGRRGQAQSPVTMRAAAAMPTDPAYVAIRTRAANILPMPSARRIPTAFEIDLNYAGKAADGKKVFDIDAGCAACHASAALESSARTSSKIGAKFGKQAMLDTS